MTYEVESDFAAHGLRCVVLMTDMGHRCGYVGIPPNHPLHGLDYSEPSPVLDAAWEQAKLGPIGKRGIIPMLFHVGQAQAHPAARVVFDVHGSLTFADSDPRYPVPNDGLWWFGFDCAHAGDAPDVERIVNAPTRGICRRLPQTGVVRSQEYLEEECRKLAEQLAAFTTEDQ